MRIYVKDPHHVESLLAFLRERIDVVAARVGEHEIETSQLGSMNYEARRLELDLLLELWRRRHEGAAARVADASDVAR